MHVYTHTHAYAIRLLGYIAMSTIYAVCTWQPGTRFAKSQLFLRADKVKKDRIARTWSVSGWPSEYPKRLSLSWYHEVPCVCSHFRVIQCHHGVGNQPCSWCSSFRWMLFCHSFRSWEITALLGDCHIFCTWRHLNILYSQGCRGDDGVPQNAQRKGICFWWQPCCRS